MEINEIVEVLKFDLEPMPKWLEIVKGKGSQALIDTTKRRIEALSSAISLLKSYQALKEKVGVEKIKDVIVGFMVMRGNMILKEDTDKLATAIKSLITKELTGEGKDELCAV